MLPSLANLSHQTPIAALIGRGDSDWRLNLELAEEFLVHCQQLAPLEEWCEVRQTEFGRAVFARKNIPKGSIVTRYAGTGRLNNKDNTTSGTHAIRLPLDLDVSVVIDGKVISELAKSAMTRSDSSLLRRIETGCGALMNSTILPKYTRSMLPEIEKRARRLANVAVDRQGASLISTSSPDSVFAHRAVDVVAKRNIKEGEELKWAYNYHLENDDLIEDATELPKIEKPSKRVCAIKL